MKTYQEFINESNKIEISKQKLKIWIDKHVYLGYKANDVYLKDKIIELNFIEFNKNIDYVILIKFFKENLENFYKSKNIRFTYEDNIVIFICKSREYLKSIK